MSTRAFYGFIYNDELKGAYNHCDGYPSYLGCNIKEELRNYDLKFMRARFNELKIIKNDESIIPNNILNEMINLGYIPKRYKNNNENVTWYSALREYQGSIVPYMEWGEYSYILDGKPYAGGDYEYGYFIDLNNGLFITKSFKFKEDTIISEEPFKYDDFIIKLNNNTFPLIIKLIELNNISNKKYLSMYQAIE